MSAAGGPATVGSIVCRCDVLGAGGRRAVLASCTRCGGTGREPVTASSPAGVASFVRVKSPRAPAELVAPRQHR